MIDDDPDSGSLSVHDYRPFGTRFDQIKSLLDGELSLETAEIVSALLSEYQEIPELIDPYLQSLVDMIVTIMRSDSHDIGIGSAMFYSLCKVRGAAVVSKFLPHAVNDFKFVLKLLRSDDQFSWQTRFSLLTWLCILVILPFPLDTIIESSSDDGGVGDLLNLFSPYLLHSAPTSTAAAKTIAYLLSRNDSNTNSLSTFIQWSLDEVTSTSLEVDTAKDINRIIGVLDGLFQLLKTVSRAKMLPYLDQIMDNLPMQLTESKSVTIRKLSMKLLQRIGMMYLPCRAALWRYKMGRRSLLHNLQPGLSKSDDDMACADSIPDSESNQPSSVEEVAWERLETILDKLLLGLSDSDTVVRWSAAKGIGRCTMRLDRTMADDVLSNIVSMLSTSSVSSQHYWHGGLLALAEFCRRGILLPSRLEMVVPIVCQGMVFEENLGTHSVGSNVRDAACYVAWSFARAYLREEMAPFAKDLSSSLIIAALFDREVNVRRAACAAFQENVGRHGLFPSGIECNTIADYFTVGNVAHSYKNVAFKIGEQQHYTDDMISHLLSLKICHWDCNLRVLACESLAILSSILPDFGCSQVIPNLISRAMSESVPERHGAIIALASLLRQLRKSDKTVADINPDLQSSIRNLIPNIEKARLYRGRGGELVRSAVCELLHAISALRFPLQPKTVKRYQQTINENIIQPNDKVRDAAVECFATFSEVYYDVYSKEDVSAAIRHFVAELDSSLNVAITRGCALALGSLPIRFVEHELPIVCSQLIAASQPIQVADRLDAETRQLSLQSLVSICCRLSNRVKSDLVNIPARLIDIIGAKISEINEERCDLFAQCISCLLLGLEDYSTDNRGDIGSWVRMAAIEGLEKMLVYMFTRGIATRAICTIVISAILKQSMEKLDKVRGLCGETLSRIVCLDLDAPLLSELRSIFCPGVDWNSASVTFPLITSLLRHPEYRTDLYSGLVISAGGLTATTARHALQSLSSLLSHNDEETHCLARDLMELTAQLMINECGNARVIVPIFNTLQHMLLHPAVKAASNESIIDRIRSLTIRQCTETRLVSVRLASIDVLCALLHYNHLSKEVANRNFSALVSNLQHKIPKVRKVCAEKFYSNLLVLDTDSGLSPEDLDHALNSLISTTWIRYSDVTALCSSLHVEPKKTKKISAPIPKNVDQEFRYQDFVQNLDR